MQQIIFVDQDNKFISKNIYRTIQIELLDKDNIKYDPQNHLDRYQLDKINIYDEAKSLLVQEMDTDEREKQKKEIDEKLSNQSTNIHFYSFDTINMFKCKLHQLIYKNTGTGDVRDIGFHILTSDGHIVHPNPVKEFDDKYSIFDIDLTNDDMIYSFDNISKLIDLDMMPEEDVIDIRTTIQKILPKTPTINIELYRLSDYITYQDKKQLQQNMKLRNQLYDTFIRKYFILSKQEFDDYISDIEFGRTELGHYDDELRQEMQEEHLLFNDIDFITDDNFGLTLQKYNIMLELDKYPNDIQSRIIFDSFEQDNQISYYNSVWYKLLWNNRSYIITKSKNLNNIIDPQDSYMLAIVFVDGSFCKFYSDKYCQYIFENEKQEINMILDYYKNIQDKLLQIDQFKQWLKLINANEFFEITNYNLIINEIQVQIYTKLFAESYAKFLPMKLEQLSSCGFINNIRQYKQETDIYKFDINNFEQDSYCICESNEISIEFTLININPDILLQLIFVFREFVEKIDKEMQEQILKQESEISETNLRGKDPVLYKQLKGDIAYTRVCQKEKRPHYISEKKYNQIISDPSTAPSALKYKNITNNTDAYYYCPNPSNPYPYFMVGHHKNDYCLPCCRQTVMATDTEKYKNCMQNYQYFPDSDQEIYYILKSIKSIKPGRLCEPTPQINHIFEHKYPYFYGVMQQWNGVNNVGLLMSCQYLSDKNHQIFAQELAATVQDKELAQILQKFFSTNEDMSYFRNEIFGFQEHIIKYMLQHYGINIIIIDYMNNIEAISTKTTNIAFIYKTAENQYHPVVYSNTLIYNYHNIVTEKTFIEVNYISMMLQRSNVMDFFHFEYVCNRADFRINKVVINNNKDILGFTISRPGHKDCYIQCQLSVNYNEAYYQKTDVIYSEEDYQQDNEIVFQLMQYMHEIYPDAEIFDDVQLLVCDSDPDICLAIRVGNILQYIVETHIDKLPERYKNKDKFVIDFDINQYNRSIKKYDMGKIDVYNSDLKEKYLKYIYEMNYYQIICIEIKNRFTLQELIQMKNKDNELIKSKLLERIEYIDASSAKKEHDINQRVNIIVPCQQNNSQYHCFEDKLIVNDVELFMRYIDLASNKINMNPKLFYEKINNNIVLNFMSFPSQYSSINIHLIDPHNKIRPRTTYTDIQDQEYGR